MAAPKKIKTVLEDNETLHETVTLTEAYSKHGHIIARHGVIEFVDGQATVSKELAEELRQQGFVM